MQGEGCNLVYKLVALHLCHIFCFKVIFRCKIYKEAIKYVKEKTKFDVLLKYVDQVVFRYSKFQYTLIIKQIMRLWTIGKEKNSKSYLWAKKKPSQNLQKIVWKQLLKLIMLNLLWKVFVVIFLQHLRPGYDGDPLKSEIRNNPKVNVKGQNMLFIITIALRNHLISFLKLLPIPIPINV